MKTLDIKVNFEKLELPSYLVFGVYFHGTLQEHLGYDLVYSWTKLYLEHEIEGCHKCKTLDGKPAKLYLWYSRYGERKGLVVDPRDIESVKYARNCMKKRFNNL